jgi:hypothetical protein
VRQQRILAFALVELNFCRKRQRVRSRKSARNCHCRSKSDRRRGRACLSPGRGDLRVSGLSDQRARGCTCTLFSFCVGKDSLVAPPAIRCCRWLRTIPTTSSAAVQSPLARDALSFLAWFFVQPHRHRVTVALCSRTFTFPSLCAANARNALF